VKFENLSSPRSLQGARRAMTSAEVTAAEKKRGVIAAWTGTTGQGLLPRPRAWHPGDHRHAARRRS